MKVTTAVSRGLGEATGREAPLSCEHAVMTRARVATGSRFIATILLLATAAWAPPGPATSTMGGWFAVDRVQGAIVTFSADASGFTFAFASPYENPSYSYAYTLYNGSGDVISVSPPTPNQGIVGAGAVVHVDVASILPYRAIQVRLIVYGGNGHVYAGNAHAHAL